MKTLIESCFPLDTHLIKKDLRRAREQKTGINGYINISHGNIKSVADYSIEIGMEYDYLVINYSEEEQRVKLATSELHFGPRTWFVCECGRRVGKLYLPPHTTQFKCRHCYSLSYEIQNISKKSKSGRFMYKTNRTIKLMNVREHMRSIFYGGKFTRRYNHWLKLSEMLGLKSNVDDARKLLSDINTD